MANNNGKAGWTENESIDWGETSKAPPPPPEPGLYRFEVAEATAKQVGKDNKPGFGLVLMLTEPYGGGEAINRKVYATHGLKKENRHVIKQLAESCDVELPTSTGTEAVKEFCTRLLDSRGGIVRIKHGKGQDNLPRAEVAFGSSYLTEAEASSDGQDAPEGGSSEPAPKRRGRNAAPAASA